MYIAARLDLLKKVSWMPYRVHRDIEFLPKYELINLLIPDESEVLSALPEKPVNNNLNLLFSHGSAQCWQSISHLLENNQLPHNT